LAVQSACHHHQVPADLSPLSLHDALPISKAGSRSSRTCSRSGSISLWRRTAKFISAISPRIRPSTSTCGRFISRSPISPTAARRSEEHTSELQSRENLVCRLLLEKKKKIE